MRIAVFSARSYDREYFDAANEKGRGHELVYFETRLEARTADLAAGFKGVCAFVNDTLDAGTLETLEKHGVRAVALRSAGFNHVDLSAAERLGIRVVRVPAYSPHAVAEHTVALMLTLNRRIHRAHARVREGNFSLEGLVGFDLHGRTVGIVGAGKIGRLVARIMLGFGCRVLAYDLAPDPELRDAGVEFVPLDALWSGSDIITLHCPLTPDTHHLVDAPALGRMKPGVMLINTSRGGVIDTRAVIDGLKSGQIGYLGIDVYEEEGDVFFRDLSDRVIQDDALARLLTFPNVLVTGHQGFFTTEALTSIAETTLENLTKLESGAPCANELKASELLNS
ncbi:MAG: 2-hydroxyacid dehydrogenase [Phycisphaerales bacterium]